MTLEPGTLDTIKMLLVTATESDTLLSVSEIRDQVGVGHGDLAAALNALREAGDAVEDAPGEWRGPYLDEADAAPVEEDVVDGVGVLDARRRDAERAAAAGVAAHAGAPMTITGTEATLTAAMADALDEAAIGALVKAGIASATQASEPSVFVFRVVP